MIDFDFCAPTRIVFGKGVVEKLPETLLEYGLDSVFLVYGSSHIKRSGLYDQIVKLLDGASIKVSELPGIRPNPTRQSVIEGVIKARENSVKAVLAVGGGSVIDASKSIAHGFYYEGDPFDFNLKKAKPEKSLPVCCVLTFGSAGSEMSDSCVIQDDETGVKMGFNHPLNRPLFALEDPELTYSVPLYQKAAAGSDIIMHSLERYFGPSGENQLSDAWALAVVKSTIEATRKCLDNPNDYEARAALMLNSSLSHNGYTGLGKTYSFVVHPLEHALSGYAPNIAHGAGVALIYPAWARYVYRKDLTKFAKLARDVFNIKGTNDEEMAIMGIVAMEDFFSSIGMPTSLKEVGLGEKDIPCLVGLASGNGTRVIGRYPQSLDEQDIENIYRSLLK